MSLTDNGHPESIVLATQNRDSQHVSQDTLQHSSQHVQDLLFNGVVFYVNPFLGTKIAQLEELLFEHGALKAPHTKPQDHSDWESSTLKTTHIISEDYDIADFKHASARGIYIVTLPEEDRKLISTVVQDFGGSFENEVNENVTHLIAVTRTEQKSTYAMDHPEMEIKVVLPHWFQMCCNLKRRFPETVYQLPYPRYHKMNVEDPPLDISTSSAPLLFSNSIKSVVEFLNTPVPDCSQFLKGLHIFLANDVNINNDLRECLNMRVAEAGGWIVDDETEYSIDMVDIVICRYRAGSLYLSASKDGKTVASADWLLHVLQTGTLTSPKASLLHYPIPNVPVEGMTNLVMTISNYTGPVREYLKRLIVALGAVYKPTMSSRTATEPTTHIICGNASGEKYNKGHEWNVKVVNHIWLEECFQTWSLQSEAKQRYTVFPMGHQLTHIFGAKLNPQNIDDWIEELSEQHLVKAEYTSQHGPIEANTSSDSNHFSTNDSHTMETNKRERTHQGEMRDQSAHNQMEALSSTPPSKSRRKSGAHLTDDPSHESGLASHIKPPANASSLEQSAVSSSGALGGVLVYTRQRGAALRASKALEQNAADMNSYHEERQNEKKALKKRKRISMGDPSGSKDGDEHDDDGEPSDDGMDVERTVPPNNPASPVKKRRVAAKALTTTTPAKSDDEEVHTSATSSREVPSVEISNMPTKRKRTSGTTVAASSNQKIREISASPSAEDVKDIKEAKETRTIKFLPTGIGKDIPAKELKQLKALSIVPAKTVEDCTHIVAEHAARTEKFLHGVVLSKCIVRKEYLSACIDANEVLDEKNYRLTDPEGKNEYDIQLYEALDRARDKRVFDNCTFYISPSTQPKPAVLKSLVELAGGKGMLLKRVDIKHLKDKFMASKGEPSSCDDDDNTSDAQQEKETIIVISCEDDMDAIKQANLQDVGARVYSKELITQSMLHQLLDLGTTYALE
ncbi:hypothetical protein BG004_003150 [Podila humilis]|nr:hypothetical protein BG004_003150 [Podila humilis]